MRKSVEHYGPQHEPQEIYIGGGVLMRVCVEYEKRRFSFMAEILRQHGQAFQKNGFDYDSYPFGGSGACYDAAAQIANAFPDTIYCEGIILAYKDEIPMPHAWCVTKDGKLIDPAGHRSQNSPMIGYFGIKFKTEYVNQWYEKYGFYGMLDGHPDYGDTVGVYVDPESEWKYVE